MKKLILGVVAIFSIAVMFTSCKETKKDSDADKHELHEHKDGETAHNAYQCPMDCEKGKTYGKEGNCPVCKMDLKAGDNDGEMKHADNCTCKEGGECKCEDGKCKCQESKECTKCEPGECTCKKGEHAEKEAVLAPTKGCSSKCATACGSKA